MSPTQYLADIEEQICDICSEQLGIRRDQVRPDSRLIEDLNCDSLDLVELIMEMEEFFGVALPDQPPNPAYKSVFTRNPFRLKDLAELVYLQRGTQPRKRRGTSDKAPEPAPASSVPFTQLDGRWIPDRGPLFEPLSGAHQFRRRSDGMRCVRIPGAEVEIGSDQPDALEDEGPLHRVELDPFLIDAEPVSTTAYCRFLNSIGDVESALLDDWFVPPPGDDRIEHLLIARGESDLWQPLPGTEQWPMMLVSWYGANVYSLWANGADWRDYRSEDPDAPCYLPSEAQWEYAARGERYRLFPWGSTVPSPARMQAGCHRRGQTYQAQSLPLSPVHQWQGMSPFGLHHMAGNVWQWCRDWYDPRFYASRPAQQRNPVQTAPTQIRSERGGSWVGSVELCHSSYRRGRTPHARGRCLGFRCLGRELP